MTNLILQNNDVSFCFIDEVAVFLDRKLDRYHYIGKAQTNALKQIEQINTQRELLHSADTLNLSNLINELTSKNFLTKNQEIGSPIKHTTHKSPTASVYDIFWGRQLSLVLIFQLAKSYAVGRRRFHRETFFKITAKAQSLKASALKKRKHFKNQEIIEISRKLVDSRYFIYSYRDMCFFDSFVFFTFFAQRHIPVDWVFGVDIYPFRAHCWVEYNGIVLNDSLERASTFTPIHVI